jgi:hypothetical protein
MSIVQAANCRTGTGTAQAAEGQAVPGAIPAAKGDFCPLASVCFGLVSSAIYRKVNSVES